MQAEEHKHALHAAAVAFELMARGLDPRAMPSDVCTEEAVRTACAQFSDAIQEILRWGYVPLPVTFPAVSEFPPGIAGAAPYGVGAASFPA